MRLEPALRDAIRLDVAAPPPLLLLPMRLEYRVIDVNVPLPLAGRTARAVAGTGVTSALVPRTNPRNIAARRSRAWQLDETRVTFTTRREIWFRWFPDDDFATRGVAPPASEELEAIARFDAECAGRPWHAVDVPEVASAWQSLSRSVAPERAVHLLRHRGEPGDANYVDAAGRITLLPKKVALYSLDRAGATTLLGEGRPIDETLRYSIEALRPEGWLAQFNVALTAGMGLRLRDDTAVTRALAASWIIAVGLADGDAVAPVSSLVVDALARNAFAFLPQDTPTNNTPGFTTSHRSSRADVLGYVRSAAQAEAGALASPMTQSAELLAEALGVNVATLAQAPGSGDTSWEDARAMLRVVGPALIDASVERTEALKGIDEEDVIAVFAEAIMARGPLPAVQFGKNPYGVLPVIDLANLAPLASDAKIPRRIEGFVRDWAALLVRAYQTAADQKVPVLQPGDPDAAAKLEQVLMMNPVSKRLEVFSAKTTALGCAYVNDSQHPAQEYLHDLAHKPLSDLPDPTASDRSYPLLYRLARLTLTKSTVLELVKGVPTRSKLNLRVHGDAAEERSIAVATSRLARRSLNNLITGTLSGVDAAVTNSLRRKSAHFAAGLARLEAIAAEPQGTAKLERLLMETLDVFHHRIDAWATGLAYRRLVKRRRAGATGLRGGYWSILGKLRAQSATGRSDGYVQAPSPQQAVTAAVLRSAHLRHGGAFSIGLNSAQVRRGLRLLDMMQAGLSTGEALGYLGERLLHDRRQDLLVFRLRDLFPLRDPRDESGLEVRLFDGLAFVNADIGVIVPPTERDPLRALQRYLAADLDAVNDVVMAEAVHLRAMGQIDAANAWLQVLSGESIPGQPTALRTHRAAHGSTHRVAVLLSPRNPAEGSPPRVIAEPTLAAQAVQQLRNFSSAVVDVVVSDESGGPLITQRLRLGADLGMTPMDLMIGGESELLLRARHQLVTIWRTSATMRATLGPLPNANVQSYINTKRVVTVTLDVGSRTARRLLADAAALRRTVAQGRVLEPGDVNAAADPAHPLADTAERDLLLGAADKLADRARLLRAALATDRAALRAAASPLLAAVREYGRLAAEAADTASLAAMLADIESKRAPLDNALLRCSRYAEPAALLLTTSAEMATDPDGLDQVLSSLSTRLAAREAALAPPTATAPTTAAEARARLDAIVAALRCALDGEALPILPPFDRRPETTPLLGAAAAPAAALAEWMTVRSKVDRVVTVLGLTRWRAFPTTDAATGADDPEAESRDESIAPRSRLFGTFLSSLTSPASATEFVGFVADEWAEQRPGREQTTGLAINYDSPQSEPPHALLLCEPVGPAAPPWSSAAAATLVAQAISLMKLRALPAQDRMIEGPLFPLANQVPFKRVGSGEQPRIPVRSFLTSVSSLDSVFVTDPAARAVGLAGIGLFETEGFNAVKE